MLRSTLPFQPSCAPLRLRPTHHSGGARNAGRREEDSYRLLLMLVEGKHRYERRVSHQRGRAPHAPPLSSAGLDSGWRSLHRWRSEVSTSLTYYFACASSSRTNLQAKIFNLANSDYWNSMFNVRRNFCPRQIERGHGGHNLGPNVTWDSTKFNVLQKFLSWNKSLPYSRLDPLGGHGSSLTPNPSEQKEALQDYTFLCM